MSQNILITGANGQLGNELRKTSAKYKDYNFIYTDVEELNITNSEEVRHFFTKTKPIVVVNCAAYTAVDKAETETDKAFAINVTGPENLAKAAKEHNAYLLHVSTDFVFDGNISKPYTEEDKPNPIGEYGRTKQLGELAVTQNHDIATIVRTAWLYSSANNNFFNTMVRLGSEKSTLNVVFDQVGTPTSAADLANALLLLADKWLKERTVMPKILHFSNEGVASWYDFAVAIMKHAGLKCKVLPIHTYEYPTPAKRPAFSVLDKTKIKQFLRIEIPHWEESLEKVVIEKQKSNK